MIIIMVRTGAIRSLILPLLAFSCISLFASQLNAEQASAENLYSPSSWRYDLPPSGLIPSYFSISTQLESDARSGGSSFAMHQAELEVPLSDPRRSGYASWAFIASLSTSYTHAETNGELSLDNNDFYRFTMPLGVIQRNESRSLFFMITPSLASDFETTDGAFTMGGIAAYSSTWGDHLDYTLGAAYFPRSFLFGFIPFVNFSWEFAPDWIFELDRSTLILEHQVSDNQKLALFFEYDGEAWTARTDRGLRTFSVSSLVAGLRWEYNIASPKVPKRLIRVELGVPFYTDADIEYRHGDQDSEFSERYKTSLRLSLGLDMRF